ncbi:hypothetical protein THAOC_36815 [Thalassiosira oceanica]|uniref:Uncharacterized protein n=1 Tax=Thalassiosira oceanica TaxID=159749 RepID=K0QZ02_THAOC|nr:hypothetical protein THAOC_36815 [Thalassiosira oceanica]|eukprot:EJK44633.1 hypothetical protein THAOC_36815 [Thalassiosira oceanica]
MYDDRIQKPQFGNQTEASTWFEPRRQTNERLAWICSALQRFAALCSREQKPTASGMSDVAMIRSDVATNRSDVAMDQSTSSVASSSVNSDVAMKRT